MILSCPHCTKIKARCKWHRPNPLKQCLRHRNAKRPPAAKECADCYQHWKRVEKGRTPSSYTYYARKTYGSLWAEHLALMSVVHSMPHNLNKKRRKATQ